MAMWNPWRGCIRYSEGCLHCYIHKGDFKRGIDTSQIVQTKDFYKPIEKKKNGEYKMKSGLVYMCFSTDFLIEEADAWREACWNMMKERSDCTFLFLTKRIDRFETCMPADWGDGYENVVVCCTVENQKNVDKKLSIFQKLPIKHKCIRQHVKFEFRQCGTHFIKDGKEYRIQTKDLMRQARLAGIDYEGVGEYAEL